jgi:hypothetical protein
MICVVMVVGAGIGQQMMRKNVLFDVDWAPTRVGILVPHM